MAGYWHDRIATTILNGEPEHEEDIESWITGLDRMKEDIRRIRL